MGATQPAGLARNDDAPLGEFPGGAIRELESASGSRKLGASNPSALKLISAQKPSANGNLFQMGGGGGGPTRLPLCPGLPSRLPNGGWWRRRAQKCGCVIL